MKSKLILTLILSSISMSAFADKTNAIKLQQRYVTLANSINPAYKNASSVEGKLFFNRKFKLADGKEVACASCHTTNPANTGKNIVTGKSIPPLSPIVNPKRFTNLEKVEDEFTKHCNDILGADCQFTEKANYIAYLLTEYTPTK